MATLALSVVGFVVGGPVGAKIGAMVGGVIDSFIFAPNVKGPRLTDLTVQASSYGQPIPLLYGNRVRCAGSVIWTTGLLETTTKKKQGKGGPTSTTYSYRASLAVLIGGTEIDGILRIWANGKVIWTAGSPALGTINSDAKSFGSAVVYPGNATQNPDPTMQSYLGSGNVPAYRNSAYVVIKDLQLADFGNAIPNLEFEVAPSVNQTVGAAVRDIATRAGATIYSTSLIGDLLGGFAIAQAQNVIAAIQPLALAYAFDIAEAGGQMRVRKRGESMIAVLPDGQRAAHDPEDQGDSAAPLGDFTTDPRIQMPRSASVSYNDSGADYQVGSQSAFRQQGADENDISVEVPLTLTADQARQIADRVLWGAWSGRRQLTDNVSDKWIRVAPGSVLGVRTADYISPMRIMRAQRGDNGQTELTMQYEDPEVYRSTAIGSTGTPIQNYVPPPGNALFLPIDTIMLQSIDDDEGFYWAVGTDSKGFRGAEIDRSTDGGVSFGLMDTAILPASIASASALPAGPTEYWDRGNILTVAMLNPDDELESASELQVLNGANIGWLGNQSGEGGEIIQFANATLVAPGVYELSDLLRGRKGTEFAAGNHGTDEYLVMLEPDTISRINFGSQDWNRDREYKAIPMLLSEADVPAVDFTNTGEAKRPLAPVHVEGQRDDADNLAISWVRRTRSSVPGLGYGPVPLGEQSEAYEVDILVAGLAVRTIKVTTPAASYSAADQTADGITPGDPVDLAVYQISASRGRGHPGAATI